MHLKSNKSLIILILFLCLTAPILSQGVPKQYVIAGISVDGNKTADAQTIISLSGLRPGDQISIPNDNKIHNAIRALWARKQFSDVQIIVDRVTALGVILLIRVDEYPRLKDIQITNNYELTDEEAKKAIAKVRGDIISPYEAYLSERKLKRKYKEDGLIFAKVKAQIGNVDSANYSNLNINVEEGREFHVKAIEFIGNKAFDNSTLESAFDKTQTKHWWQLWKSSKFDLTEYDKDKELLKNFYKNKGFRDIEIVKDSVAYYDNDGTVAIKVTVNEGSRLVIRNIEFSGNSIYPSSALLARLDFKSGDAYNLEKFQQNLNGNQEQTDANSIYMDNGYLFSRMDVEENRVPPDSIDIKIVVTEGSRVTIRKVNIVGNTKTKDKVIRRELYTRPGDFFNRSAVIRSVRALGMLNYFNPEALKPDVQYIDKTKVDVVYKVEERSTDTFNASIGFAGTYGLTGSIGFSFNNFSISEPLKGGAGELLNFTWMFGEANRYQNFGLGWTEPWLFDEPTTVGFNIFDTKYNYGYSLRQTGAQLNFGRRFRWPDDYFRGDLSARFQRNDVGTSDGIYFRQGITTEASLGLTFSRVNLDNQFFPTEGSKFIFSNEYAMGALGIGTIDYFKSSLKMEINQPLMQFKGINRLVLALGLNQGFITGIKSDTMTTPNMLYYMGGNGLSGFNVTPLRGYQDQSVGPQRGGRILSHYYSELRFAVAQDPMPIYVYGFAEAGNVWANLKSTDPFNLKRAAGFGVKLLLNPIGLIGFSYGYGFDKDDRTGQISGWRFLFHFGQ